jgi:hypothetical protein
LFTTKTLHLEGEEVFGFAQCGAHFVLGVDDKSHRPDHINFFRPHVAIPACQPNSVNDLSIAKSPCVAQKYVSYIFSRWHNG